MKSYTRNLYFFPVIALITSCSSLSEKSPAANAAPKQPILTSAKTPQNLSLSSACSLALKHHSSMATYPMDRRAADARVLNATQLPSPELSIDAEDFLGIGAVRGLSSAMLNTVFSQLIERGGKRQARVDAMQSQGLVMDAEYEVKRRELIRQTCEFYIKALAAQEDMLYRKASLKRSKETLDLVKSLFDAERVTISAVNQAELEVYQSELDLATAEKQKERTSRELTSLWGDSRSALFYYNSVGNPPNSLASQKVQKQGLLKHPSIRVVEAQVKQAESNLMLAKANRHADVNVFGGVRNNNDNNSSSGLLGISLPLGVFKRGRYTTAEMQAMADKASTELLGAKRELQSDFALAWSDLVAAHQEARTVKEKLLPSALKLFQSADSLFREGKISSLEYLAAKQQFHEVRGRWLTSRRDYQLNAIRVQSLTNLPL